MLGDFWPPPVPLAAGERFVWLQQMRVRDLAVLEAAAGGGATPFYRELAVAQGLEDATERGRALGRLLLRAGRLPAFGDAAVGAWLDSPPGRLEVLRLALAEYQPGLTIEGVLDVAEALDAPGWHLVELTAWAWNPKEAAAAALDAEAGIVHPEAGEDGRPADWRGMVRSMLKRYPGLTPQTAGALYLSQWFALCGDGPSHPIAEPAPRPGLTLARIQEAILRPRRAYLEALGFTAEELRPPSRTARRGPPVESPNGLAAGPCRRPEPPGQSPDLT